MESLEPFLGPSGHTFSIHPPGTLYLSLHSVSPQAHTQGFCMAGLAPGQELSMLSTHQLFRGVGLLKPGTWFLSVPPVRVSGGSVWMSLLIEEPHKEF